MKYKLMKIAALLLAATMAARADSVDVALSNLGVQSGAAGSTLHYTGVLVNNSVVTAFPKSLSSSGLLPGFTVNTFDGNMPLFLMAGQSSGSILLFDVVIPALAAPGSYTGLLVLTGALDDGPSQLLGATNFTVNVTTSPTAVPEPSTLAMLLLGVLAVSAGSAFRRRRIGHMS